MTHNPTMDLPTLEKNLWETSGARFNAAERLARQSSLSLYAGAALSLAAIMMGAASVLQPASGPAVTLAAMLASSAALAFSLTEAGAGHGVKSERLHANALRLRALMRGINSQDLPEALALYHKALLECPENHLPADWQLAVDRQRAPGWRVELRYAAKAYGWRVALLLTGLVGAVSPLTWL